MRLISTEIILNLIKRLQKRNGIHPKKNIKINNKTKQKINKKNKSFKLNKKEKV